MLRNKLRAFVANQLGFPTGWFGKLLIRFLNHNNALMNDLVLHVLNLQAGDRILEIGFGGGYLLNQIMNTDLQVLTVGIERSPDAINFCNQKFQDQINQNKLELYLADAAQLPFPDGEFSHICTVNTIYFWTDVAKVLTECHRVLAPKGKLAISYNPKDFLEKHQFTQHGFSPYEVPEIEMMLKAAGFKAVSTVSNYSDRRQKFFCSVGYA